MNYFLIALSENDKRILIALLLVLVLVFVIVGYLGLLVEVIFRKQGTEIETVLTNAINYKTIKTSKQFKKVGGQASRNLLLKQSSIPLLILLLTAIILLIYYGATGNWDLNVFDYKTEGFFTLFWIFDWSQVPTTDFFGMTIINGWPPVISNPHFETEALISYFIVPLTLVGGIWYLVTAQAYLARTLRIRKLSKSLFTVNLSEVNIANEERHAFNNRMNQQVPPQPQQHINYNYNQQNNLYNSGNGPLPNQNQLNGNPGQLPNHQNPQQIDNNPYQNDPSHLSDPYGSQYGNQNKNGPSNNDPSNNYNPYNNNNNNGQY